jgi:hypothetical protein
MIICFTIKNPPRAVAHIFCHLHFTAHMHKNQPFFRDKISICCYFYTNTLILLKKAGVLYLNKAKPSENKELLRRKNDLFLRPYI